MTTKKSILVVDDEPAIRKLLAGMLAKFDTDTAQDVDSALEKISTKPYDLIISDVRMPGKTGEDLLNALVEQNINIPIVFMTGHMDSGDHISELKTKSFDCLTKPFRVRQLMQVVNQVFSSETS